MRKRGFGTTCLRAGALALSLACAGASTPLGAATVDADPAHGHADPPVVDGTLVFERVNVLPMDAERVLRDQTVLVVDGIVTRMGPTGSVDIPADAVRIDGTGRWLMPGLAEMHAHVPPVPSGRPPQQLLEDYMFLYVANGITTIRGMLGSPYQIDLRAELEGQELIGPRFYPGAPSLNNNSAPTPAAAERLVRDAAAAGYDLQKIHPGVSRATWDHMVRVAREVGLPWGGHVPAAVGVEHALRTGMTTVDHVDGYLEAAADPSDPPFGGAAVGPDAVVGSLDEARMVELADLTAEMGAFVVPTQYLWQNLFGARDTERVLAQPEMAYVSPQQRQAWRNQAANNPVISPATRTAFLDARDRMLVLLADRDVVMMGTDSPQLFNVPGFALHREIDVMADAGMTSWQILRSGTATVGRYVRDVLGYDLDLGVVREGAVADLVLLDGNPLEDLDALHARAGVMVRGRWISGTAIEAGLADIAARNAGG